MEDRTNQHVGIETFAHCYVLGFKAGFVLIQK